MRRSQTQGAQAGTLNRHVSGNHNNNSDDTSTNSDLAPYFGDLPRKLAKNCIRVGSINLDNLSQYEGKTKNPKDEQLFTSINNYEINILMMQELGLNWDAVNHADQWRERVKANLEYQQTKSYVSHNKQDPKRHPRQWGGTGILSYGKVSFFAMGAGSDKAQLGRWTWSRFRGKGDIVFRCVSLYRPSNSRNGEETVYQQHKEYLQRQNDDRCPRAAFLEDLDDEMAEWLAEGDQLLVTGDINDNIFSQEISDLFAKHNMRNIIFDRHDPQQAPTTYYRTRSNRIVDGMWATPNIVAERCGYLEPGEFPGNHSLIWADISYVSALGHNPPEPHTPGRRRLQLWNRNSTKKYLRTYTRLERKYKLWERQMKLEQSLQPDLPLTRPQKNEANAIDATRTVCMKKAERKCRKLMNGAVGFSEATEQPKRELAFWELAIRRRKGMKVSSRLWRRRKTKAKITTPTAHLSTEEMIHLQKAALKQYRKAKKNHSEERRKYLDTLDRKDIDRLKRNEAAREKGRAAKLITGKLQSKSVTKVELNGRESTKKVDIENVFKAINYAKIRASDDTAFLQTPLRSIFGYRKDTPADDAVLSGTFQPPPNTDPHAIQLIQGLRQPPQLLPENRSFHPRTTITTEDHIRGWRKVKEQTSSGPSGLHFGMFKANTKVTRLADIDASIRSVAYTTGFSYSRWRKGLDVQLLKRSQDYRAEKQRTILLLEADFNMNNRTIGSDAMRAGERANIFTKDNYGGRKKLRANEIAMNSTLTHNSIWGRRGRAIIMSNDAKGCYDRIAHIVVKLALRRLGIPKPALQSMIKTIQHMEHYIRTAFGDSEQGYKRKHNDPPPQGVLQGNGAGPAGWFAISTVIIEELKKAGYGYKQWTLIRRRALAITCFAFVDDTDIIHSNNDPSVSTAQLLSEAQDALNMWEGLIRATGGDLAPEKSYWYLVEVIRKRGKWVYAKSTDRPGALTLQKGAHTLKRNEVSQAEEALGIQSRPDANMKDELKYLKAKVAKWCDAVRTRRIKPGDVWYCLNSTIMKTIEYPLTATTFSQKELKELMSPLLMTALPRSGVQRRLPRTLVYGTLRARGLNVKDPYITQLIHHLQALLRHQARDTQSRDLHEENADLVQLHIGSEFPFWELPYEDYGLLAPKGWIKHTWMQLAETRLSIKGEDGLTSPPRRTGDIYLMDAFIAQGYSDNDILALNDCRLYLQATTLSDLCSADGLSITHEAWNGICKVSRQEYEWINTHKPGNNTWNLWRTTIKSLFLDPNSLYDRKLIVPLGDWLQPTDLSWTWWIDPALDIIYERTGPSSWSTWQRQTSQGLIARYHSPLPIHTAGWPTTLTRISVTIARNRNFVYFHNAGNSACHPTANPIVDLETALASFPPTAQWAIRYVHHSDQGHHIAAALRQGTAIAVSDGSLKFGLGTAAFIVEAPEQRNNIRGVNKVPGPIVDGDSHRCEVSGIYSTILLVEAVCTLHGVSQGSITMACDNDTSLRLFDEEYIPDPTDKNYDIVLATSNAIARSPVRWVGRIVEGHQDKHTPVESLDRFAQLNIAMDTLAKKFWQHLNNQTPSHITPKPDIHPIYGEGLQLWKGTTKITRPFTNHLYGLITDDSSQYWWVRHNNIPENALNDINWDAMENGMAKLPPARRRWTTKMAAQECGIGTTLARWGHQDDAKCPRCNANEDSTHVYQCKGCGADMVWESSINRVDDYLTKTSTHPDIQQCIIDGLQGWRQNNPIDPNNYDPVIRPAIVSQSNIGWQNMLEGAASIQWQQLQSSHYSTTGSRKSSKRWSTGLHKKLHHLAWHQWKHRNDTKFITKQPRHKKMIRELHHAIVQEYQLGAATLLPSDRHHLRHNIATLLYKKLSYKQSWIANVKTARLRFQRIQQQNNDLQDESRSASRLLQWINSGRCF